MDISGIHHVTLIVDDEQAARRFYGEVLALEEKPRPGFKFPGLFYLCGNQEIHLIVASRPMPREDLYIRIDGRFELTRRHIHRHAALLVSDWDGVQHRLVDSGIAILFGPERIDPVDELSRNMVEGWMKMYGAVPIFVHDPFGNLIELVPTKPRGNR